MTWGNVELTGDLQLVIGLRDERRRLTGYRVDVDRDVHADLRGAATGAMNELAGRTAVPYTPYVDQEEANT